MPGGARSTSAPAAASPTSTPVFRGFPPAAIQFFEGLEADNSKAYWTAHKDEYDQAVRGPMEALVASVDERYRPVRLFRPYRDVRFSKDKAPYKTTVAAAGETEDGAVVYVQVSAQGLMAGSGYYQLAADQLERFRAAVADERTGPQIAAVAAALVRNGYTLGAVDELKTAPRGYPRDHPRVDLLRRKGLVGLRSWPVRRWLHTAQVRDRVQEVWRACDPLNAWLATNVGPSELPPEGRGRR